jgi:hypothetical protein
VKPSASPRAGIFVQGAKPKRSCTGRTASFGDKALGEKTLPELKRVRADKRGGVMGFTTGS